MESHAPFANAGGRPHACPPHCHEERFSPKTMLRSTPGVHHEKPRSACASSPDTIAILRIESLRVTRRAANRSHDSAQPALVVDSLEAETQHPSLASTNDPQVNPAAPSTCPPVATLTCPLAAPSTCPPAALPTYPLQRHRRIHRNRARMRATTTATPVSFSDPAGSPAK